MREDEESVLTQLACLRGMGVGVAIDDFGTGYSSLGRLRALPVDKVKIDRSFIARLGQEAGADTVVRAMVALGHGLGLHVTAEGVENESQFRFLRSARCDSVQGFLIGRPVRAKDLDKVTQDPELRGPAVRRDAMARLLLYPDGERPLNFDAGAEDHKKERHGGQDDDAEVDGPPVALLCETPARSLLLATYRPRPGVSAFRVPR